jgi:hypothetical protein
MLSMFRMSKRRLDLTKPGRGQDGEEWSVAPRPFPRVTTLIARLP